MSDHSLRDQLMHSNGTTPFETMSIIAPMFLYTFLTTTIVSLTRTYYSTNRFLQFSIEFVALVAPLLLNITVLAEESLIMSVTTFVAIITIIGWLSMQKASKNIKETAPKTGFVTNARSAINIISVAAILAVDFRVFPRRFAKTETFGYSLMDVGVGLFMYANGIVDGGAPNLVKSLKGVLPLLLIGTGRFFITNEIDYHVPISEYGVHWNFFVTLAVTKLFVTLILNVVNVRFVWINAVLLLVSHEILLQMGLRNFVMTDAKRDNFVLANKEGLVSSMGYVSLYLLSAWLGHFLGMKNPKNRRRTVVKFALSSLVLLGLTLTLENFCGISRRLANSAYVFWVLFIGIFMTGLFHLGEAAQNHLFKGKLPNCVYSSFISDAVNYNGLTFFLVSNLLTGAINIACDTLKIDDVSALAIIFTYMLANCALVCVLHQKHIKLKL